MINAVSLTSIPEYENWLNGGGAARSGIPVQSFAPLTAQAHQFRGLAVMFKSHLDGALDLWTNLATGSGTVGDNVLKANLGILATRLMLANSDAVGLIHLAAALKISVQDLYGVIDRYVRADAAAVQSATVQLQTYQTLRVVKTAEYNAARSELEGAEGFLNGFLTAITLTAYNPAKDNMDRARNALTQINTSIMGYNSQIAVINARQTEIANSRVAATKIEKVDSSIVQCQNVLNAAQSDVLDALTQVTKADSKTLARVIEIYVNKATTAMDTLREWNVAFAAVT